MQKELRHVDSCDLVDRGEPVRGDQPHRNDRVATLARIGHGGIRALEHQPGSGIARGQLHRDTGTKRMPKDDDAACRNTARSSQKVVRGLRIEIQAGLGWRPFLAGTEPAIVERQYPHAERAQARVIVLTLGQRDVAGIAVTDQHPERRGVAGRRRNQPRGEVRAVRRVEPHGLHVQLGGRRVEASTLECGLSRMVDERRLVQLEICDGTHVRDRRECERTCQCAPHHHPTCHQSAFLMAASRSCFPPTPVYTTLPARLITTT